MQREPRRYDQSGSALVLAIIFLLAIALVILALGSFAVQASSTNVSVRAQAKIETAAETAVTAAIQQVRVSWNYPTQIPPVATVYSNSLLSTPTAQPCTPSGATSGEIVYCQGWQIGTSRLVDFFVCGSSYATNDPATCLAKTELFASVTYTDIPDGGAPNSASCTKTSNATCGISMSIGQWDVRISDS